MQRCHPQKNCWRRFVGNDVSNRNKIVLFQPLELAKNRNTRKKLQRSLTLTSACLRAETDEENQQFFILPTSLKKQSSGIMSKVLLSGEFQELFLLAHENGQQREIHSREELISVSPVIFNYHRPERFQIIFFLKRV
jgi:hypothetical protein